MSSKIIKAESDQIEGIVPLQMKELQEERVAPFTQPAIPGDSPETDQLPKDEEFEDEAAVIRRTAYEEGVAQGRSEALKESSERIDPVLDAFLGATKDLSELQDKLFLESEDRVVELIVAVAKKIIQKEIKVDHDLVANVIKRAMKNLTDRTEIMIRVHPEDCKLIHEKRQQFFGELDELKNVTFQEDESLNRGGCLIESKFGEIDARIEKQLSLLEEGLKDALHE